MGNAILNKSKKKNMLPVEKIWNLSNSIEGKHLPPCQKLSFL